MVVPLLKVVVVVDKVQELVVPDVDTPETSEPVHFHTNDSHLTWLN
jgi:hypothetical protein